MGRVLVDSTVLIAFADTDDEDHDRGEEIVRAIDHGGLVTGVIVHDALLEVLNFVNERQGHRKAVHLLDRLEESAHYRLPTIRRETSGAAGGSFGGFRPSRWVTQCRSRSCNTRGSSTFTALMTISTLLME